MDESFFSTLKLELALDDKRKRKELIDPKALQRDLAFWIEGYYNKERRHSTIGYLSPVDYEQQFTVALTLTPTGHCSLYTVSEEDKHPFRLIKHQFGFEKTQLRGLVKNRCKIHVLAALTNLFLARRRLLTTA